MPPAELWIDREDAVDEIARRQASAEITAQEAENLRDFHRDGYVILPRAIDAQSVAALREELATLYLAPERYVMRLPKQQLVHPQSPVLPERSRLLDLYVPSELARAISLSAPILRFFALLYDEPAMAFQSLLFTWGSEQSIHKDTAFVVVDKPCTLVASWIALETVSKGQGELVYYPGSHRDPLFLFGGNSLSWRAAVHGKGVHKRYTDYLHKQASDKGVAAKSFFADAGDVLLWHPNLAHGGAEVTEPGKTRLSLVTHYCPASANPGYFSRLDRNHRMPWHGGHCGGYYSSRHYLLRPDGFDPPVLR